jgi:SAM-dependent MidA family methyltransferase
MALANKRYYSTKGKKIYSDFSTFAQGKALAACNAMEFCRDFGSGKSTVVVCEYGIGKGDFAKTFLDEVKKLNKTLYSRVRYYLFDFSEKMLSDARKNLSAHKAICIFGILDAVCEQPSLPFDYCRINELFTDLPAQFFMEKGGKITEYRPGKNGQLEPFTALAPPSPVVSSFLSRMEEGRIIPFNNVAEKFLLSLSSIGKDNFRIDIFDYGFYEQGDFLLPAEEWNRLMVRPYGKQLTTDLNFLQLRAALSLQGAHSHVEKQKAYCEKALNKKLTMVHNKLGLDYASAKKDNIEEDDGFYHLRVGR